MCNFIYVILPIQIKKGGNSFPEIKMAEVKCMDISIILLIAVPILITYILYKKKYKTKLEKTGVILLGLIWLIHILINFVL